jgi:hypothetical protein
MASRASKPLTTFRETQLEPQMNVNEHRLSDEFHLCAFVLICGCFCWFLFRSMYGYAVPSLLQENELRVTFVSAGKNVQSEFPLQKLTPLKRSESQSTPERRPNVMTSNTNRPQIRAGMVGMGMIFDDTYRPFFENVKSKGSLRSGVWRCRCAAGGGRFENGDTSGSISTAGEVSGD